MIAPHTPTVYEAPISRESHYKLTKSQAGSVIQNNYYQEVSKAWTTK